MTDPSGDPRSLVHVFWDALAILAVRALEHRQAIDACDPRQPPRTARISVPMQQLAALALHHGAADGYGAAADALCGLAGVLHDTPAGPEAHIAVDAVPPLTETVRVRYSLPLPPAAVEGNAYRDRPAGPVETGPDPIPPLHPVSGDEPN